jgi:hypothetical protein
MIDRWNRLVVDHPWWVIGLSLLLTVLAAISLKDFTNNNDPRIFFTEDNPDYRFSASWRTALPVMRRCCSSSLPLMATFLPAAI